MSKNGSNSWINLLKHLCSKTRQRGKLKLRACYQANWSQTKWNQNPPIVEIAHTLLAHLFQVLGSFHTGSSAANRTRCGPFSLLRMLPCWPFGAVNRSMRGYFALFPPLLLDVWRASPYFMRSFRRAWSGRRRVCAGSMCMWCIEDSNCVCVYPVTGRGQLLVGELQYEWVVERLNWPYSTHRLGEINKDLFIECLTPGLCASSNNRWRKAFLCFASVCVLVFDKVITLGRELRSWSLNFHWLRFTPVLLKVSLVSP